MHFYHFREFALTNDKAMVGWRTSSIRRPNELPKVCIYLLYFVHIFNDVGNLSINLIPSHLPAKSSSNWSKLSTHCIRRAWKCEQWYLPVNFYSSNRAKHWSWRFAPFLTWLFFSRFARNNDISIRFSGSAVDPCLTIYSLLAFLISIASQISSCYGFCGM